MVRRHSKATVLIASIVVAIASATASHAQPLSDAHQAAGAAPVDPQSPVARSYAAQQKKRLAAERELKKIRFQHFGSVTNVEIRQAGILKLRAYTDASVYPSLIEIFRDEKNDVRQAVLDHLADRRSDEGDTCLAWIATRDRSRELRTAAAARLAARIQETGGASPRIAMVVYGALQSGDESLIAQGAELAAGIGMVETIPWLIAAQLGSAPVSSGSEPAGNGDLAWIMVGTQTAFVSDLTPVVAESAVAFDPQLSVVTEGVILRVHDAAVTTYRHEVHNALIELSERSWGRPTRGLGWDQDAWRDWYKNQYLPSRKPRPLGSEANLGGVPPK